MVNQALGLVLGLVSWKPERQSNTQQRFASTARRAVLPPAHMQFQPRVVLVYSCEMKKKKSKAQTILFIPFWQVLFCKPSECCCIVVSFQPRACLVIRTINESCCPGHSKMRRFQQPERVFGKLPSNAG